ncbi:MAG: insulinase family protein [Pelagimonas sp.]|jgi:zinc protease|nr:insulinase family protein [Pelagimonas sp.]
MKMIKQLSAALALGLMTWALAQPAQAEIDIEQVTTPGGFNAWLVQDDTIPFVALELRFRGGASMDDPARRGAANLMTALLEEGAGPLDAQGFAREAEALAAQFDYDISDDALSVSARFLSENQDEAVALLRQSLIAPRFDADAIERVRAQIQLSIRSDQRDPDALASQAWDRYVYGDHPYGSPLDGTVDSVTALTRDDLLTSHRGLLTRDRAYIAASGDISAEALSALLDALLADLPDSTTALPEKAQIATRQGISVTEFATPQSVAIFGHKGLPRDDPDFFAAYVMNVVLGGGGFESRLMQEVREKRGLTYGVYSYLASRDLADLYVGQVASANDRIAEAIAVIRSEWARLAQDGVSKAELEQAKTYLTGGYPLRFDGNGRIANILVGMQMQGLDPSYVTTRNAQIEAVTLEDIQRVAARILKPEDLHFVVVGQPTGLELEAGN